MNSKNHNELLLLSLLVISFCFNANTTTSTFGVAAATAGVGVGGVDVIRRRNVNRKQKNQQQRQQQPNHPKKNTNRIIEHTYRYNVCNGFSNQLLYHAASIAIAITHHYDYVNVPDAYIVDGVQYNNDDILPNESNAVPFGTIFDRTTFINVIESLGTTRVRFVDMITTNDSNNNDKIMKQQQDNEQQIQCAGMTAVNKANSVLMNEIIQLAFVPSQQLQYKIQEIQFKLPSSNDNNGVCLHHRDGYDWHEHCKRWSNIKDGIYRGNCLTIHNLSLMHALQDRGLVVSSSDNETDNDLEQQASSSWVYYCGDHEPPKELTDAVRVYTNDNGNHKGLFSSASKSSQHVHNEQVVLLADNSYDTIAFVDSNTSSNSNRSSNSNDDNAVIPYTKRDVLALIDFFICKDMKTFIGNSVSTFSAIQIAIRNGRGIRGESSSSPSAMNNGGAYYWYNSQSIPLASFWKVYTIPIVYTYTELSKGSGKHLLIASINSVRHHMPNNPIHILYHCIKDDDQPSDAKFIEFLQLNDIIIHYHISPTWKDSIEQMRTNGHNATSSSNLFLHSGNYFGTWQRIDIPLYIRTEYCLLLDSDTIVIKPFTIANFGLNLTYSISMSAEMDRNDHRPWNAGVTVMNIPYLRKTHDNFVQYILRHVSTATFDHPAPSDQGAYLSFYNATVTFLSTAFNFKPYWHNTIRLSNNNDVARRAAREDIPSTTRSKNTRGRGGGRPRIIAAAKTPSSDLQLQKLRNIRMLDEFDGSYIIHFHGAKPHDYLSKLMGNQCDEAIGFLCDDMYNMEYLCPSLHKFFRHVPDHQEYCLASFPNSMKQQKLCYIMTSYIANTEYGCPIDGNIETVLGIAQQEVMQRHTDAAAMKATGPARSADTNAKPQQAMTVFLSRSRYLTLQLKKEAKLLASPSLALFKKMYRYHPTEAKSSNPSFIPSTSFGDDASSLDDFSVFYCIWFCVCLLLYWFVYRLVIMTFLRYNKIKTSSPPPSLSITSTLVYRRSTSTPLLHRGSSRLRRFP